MIDRGSQLEIEVNQKIPQPGPMSCVRQEKNRFGQNWFGNQQRLPGQSNEISLGSLPQRIAPVDQGNEHV